MIQGISHIGIAVKDIGRSLAALSKTLDLPMPAVQDHPDKKIKVAVVDLFGIGLEFIEDYSEEGQFAEFVRKRGDGIHHISLLTDAIEADIRELESRGIEMVDRKPKMGVRGKRIAFTKPTALNGIPLELSEP